MRIFLSFICVCMVFFTAQAGGIDPNDINLTAASSNSLLLHIEKPLQDDAQVEILDKQGRVLHTEQLAKGNKTNKLFQLAALPYGSYIMQLTSSMHIDRYPFTIEKGGVRLTKEDISRQYRPMLVTKAGITQLSFPNETQQKVSVTLQNDKGEEIYTEFLPAEAHVTRRYNFRQLPQGNYQLVVQAGQDRVVHSLAL